jgi:hypothetical protein
MLTLQVKAAVERLVRVDPCPAIFGNERFVFCYEGNYIGIIRNAPL